MKALKAFIKPFEAPQKSAKISFSILIQLIEMHGTGSVKNKGKFVIKDLPGVSKTLKNNLPDIADMKRYLKIGLDFYFVVVI